MVRLLLSIKADLEDVTKLRPTEDFEYFFKVKCTQCNDIHPKTIGINRQDEYEVAGGRGGMANFVWKCGTCKREASARFEPSFPTIPYSAENGQYAPFVALDCRNLEFVEFDPKGTWECVGVDSGTKFDDVDFSEGDWTDYDEKSAQPVGVSNVEGKWTRA